MGTKIQPIALRLGHSVSWKSNWQAQSDEYADMAFRDNQLEELMRNFLRQHGILMGDLYVQETINDNGSTHLILTSTFYTRKRPFLTAFKRKNNLFEIKQLNRGRRRYAKRKGFLRQYISFALNEIIKVKTPALIRNFLDNFDLTKNQQISFELRLINVHKVGRSHSKKIHWARRITKRKNPRVMRTPYSRDMYFLLHKMFLLHNTTMVGDLIATLLEKTKKHHLVLNRVEELMKIVYEQYGEINGVRIQTKGRIAGSKRKRKRVLQVGKLSLQKIDSPIHYTCHKSVTRFGVTSIKIWLA